MLDLLIYIPVTLVCLVPFAFSCFYCFVSIRLMITAQVENSSLKKRSSIYTFFFSLSGIFLSYITWSSLVDWLEIAPY